MNIIAQFEMIFGFSVTKNQEQELEKIKARKFEIFMIIKKKFCVNQQMEQELSTIFGEILSVDQIFVNNRYMIRQDINYDKIISSIKERVMLSSKMF